jgi:asparagine synthase (glutamine-hydrolysing)
MEGILPNEILYRPKRGFAVPLGHWFRGKLGSFMRDLLFSKTSLERGIFNKSYLERLIDMNDRGRSMDLQLWTLITFELWCRRFIDESPVCRSVPATARRNMRQRENPTEKAYNARRKKRNETTGNHPTSLRLRIIIQ